MVETLNQESLILSQEHITPTELFIIRALLSAQEDDNITAITEYMKIPEPIRGNFRDILLRLQNRGIIVKSSKIPNVGERLSIYDIKFNQNLIKRLHKASFDLGKELYAVYPEFARINGVIVPIKTVSKKYNSLEDAFIAYAKAIKNNPELHSEIIELVNWANENNILNCSLASFIVDHRWEALRSLKSGDSGINYNSVKMI